MIKREHNLDLIGKKFGTLKVLLRNNDKTWKCECECGTIKNLSTGNLKKAKSCGLCKKRKHNLKGRKIYKLLVLDIDKTDKKNTYWLCECECGVRKTYTTGNLIDGKLRSCGCSKIKIGPQHKNWNGVGDLTGGFYHNIKCQAKRKKIDFNVSKEFLWNLFEKQNSKCALTGLDLLMPVKSDDVKNGNKTASLDRINSDIGYLEDNVQWVHKDINMMKQSLQQSKFIDYCKLVDHNFFEKTNDKNIDGNQKLTKSFYCTLKAVANRRGLYFNVSKEYLWDLFEKQNGKCVLTGLSLNFPLKAKDVFNGNKTTSLDRVNSDIGYLEGNVQWVHKDVNMMKQSYDMRYFLEMCNHIKEYNK